MRLKRLQLLPANLIVEGRLMIGICSWPYNVAIFTTSFLQMNLHTLSQWRKKGYEKRWSKRDNHTNFVAMSFWCKKNVAKRIILLKPKVVALVCASYFTSLFVLTAWATKHSRLKHSCTSIVLLARRAHHGGLKGLNNISHGKASETPSTWEVQHAPLKERCSCCRVKQMQLYRPKRIASSSWFDTQSEGKSWNVSVWSNCIWQK